MTGPRRSSNVESPPESFLPTLPDDRAEPSTKPSTVTSSPTSISPFPSQPRDTTPLSLPPSALAGKTLDLTLLTTVHALSVLLTGVWPPPSRRTRLTNLISSATLPALFTFSCSTIMHAYFYAPFRLPHAYVSWISRFARLDPRLLRALREARFGNWRYGRDDGLGGLLGDMAQDLGLPRTWGDPAKTVPVPCQLVHQGMGKGCEVNAGVRFARAWVEAAKMYLPLRLGVVVLRWLLRLRRQRLYGRGTAPGARTAAAPLSRLLIPALADAARSSAFLAAFVSLFYYGVCLARTRLGPRIFSPKTVTPQMWDSGLCIHAGCLLCGLSFLVLPTEGNGTSSRRADIVFFVLPRALGVWFPRRYERKYLWREGAVFAVGAAAVVTAAMERPEMVGGVLGRVLKGVFAE
ncbi:hypothetical protein W97_07163 [Coniosporium apollinis CBS 100218]|uniref:Uncharacterized protein n=1 Tax=Coniosporium apollinis (strain CBS 100218) TaxID=1168221 RepID=R7Z268_CONA1|nr:uncharacterized protein W97_07163 [Coniosporium apollinis CBS 100218]EON68016.1 hypothetical protein W97_07163 [Coniosporium apollinis CBS 100218]